MQITALSLSRLQLPVRSRFTTRLPNFVALMKPRVMLLAVFTAFVGMIIAPGHLDPLLGSVAIAAIAAGAGAAGVLNMWFDADIDALMARTARRPIPRGEVSCAEALLFGLILACSAVVILALALNIKAAALLAFTIFFYVVVYTMWLKRQMPQNIVIGRRRQYGRRCQKFGPRVSRSILTFPCNSEPELARSRGTVHLRKVDIAHDLGTRVELDTGVRAGDHMILYPPVNLGDGGKVQVRTEAVALDP